MPRKERSPGGGKQTQRKRRLSRLPVAPYYEFHPVFSPSSNDWARIQATCQIDLDEKQRSEIATIIENYFVNHNMETNAPFQKDAQTWLDRFCKILDRLVQSTTLKPTDTKIYAGEWATVEIVCELAKLRPTPIMRWNDIRRLIFDLRAAGERARASIRDEGDGGGFVEGSAWKLLINQFLAFAEDHRLPTSVSKGQRGLHIARASLFVRFVWELQQLFPMEYRRHYQSRGALAGAMSKIKRARKSGTISQTSVVP